MQTYLRIEPQVFLQEIVFLKGLPGIISNQWMVAWPLVNYFSRPQPQAIDDLQAAPSRWPDSILETTQWSRSSRRKNTLSYFLAKMCIEKKSNIFLMTKYLKWIKPKNGCFSYVIELHVGLYMVISNPRHVWLQRVSKDFHKYCNVNY